MRPAVFIAGAHTDIGKTHAACGLIRAARGRGRAVAALKPVASGLDAADLASSDPGRLLAALGRPLDAASLAEICPLRFAAPLSPPMAARREGRALILDQVIAPCRAALARADHDLLLIEGVGGLMSPIAEDATGLDLMTALAIPAVIVGGAYLGAISHALTALVAARAAGVEVRALIVSQCADPDAPDFAETVIDVQRFAGSTPVVALSRDTDDSWAGEVLQRLL